MKDHAANEVSDEDFARRHERWPHDTPDTKEAYYIRDVFDSKLIRDNMVKAYLTSIQACSLRKLLPRPPSGTPLSLSSHVSPCR